MPSQNSKMIKVSCPYCRKEATVDEEAAQRGFPCDSCGRIVTVSGSDASESDKTDFSDLPIKFKSTETPGRTIAYIIIALAVIIGILFGASRLGIITVSVGGTQSTQGTVPEGASAQMQSQAQNDSQNEAPGNNSHPLIDAADLSGTDRTSDEADAPEIKSLLDFISEAEQQSQEEDESFLSLEVLPSDAPEPVEFNPDSEVELNAGATVKLPDDSAIIVLVLKISMSAEWVVLDVQEGSIDFSGTWQSWREVVGSSYLVTESEVLMLPAIENCRGWTDGLARAGSERGGTIAFPNNLSSPEGKMTLYYAYNPSLEDEGRAAVEFSIDPSQVITNPRFDETGSGGGSGFSQDDAFDFITRGFESIDLNDYQGAIDEFSRAIDIDPLQTIAWNGRGIAHNMLGENTEALDDFSEVLRLEPGNLTVRVNRAKVYIELGEYDEAMSDLDNVISIDPYISSAYYYRGWVYSAQGDDHKAIEDLTLAIEYDPENSVYYFARALAYERLGESDASAADIRTAEELGGG